MLDNCCYIAGVDALLASDYPNACISNLHKASENILLVRIGVGAICAVMSVATPTFAAVTITNQDSRTHTITVDRGTSQSQQDIAGGKSAQIDCPDKCGFHDEANGFSRVAGGDSKLVIDKDAELHFVGGRGDMTMPNGTN